MFLVCKRYVSQRDVFYTPKRYMFDKKTDNNHFGELIEGIYFNVYLPVIRKIQYFEIKF